MNFYYVAKFEPNENGGYTVTFPDLEGAITEGDTKEEALSYAQEALELYLEPDIPFDAIEKFPTPTPIEEVPIPEGGFTSYIVANVDLAKYSKSVKKTLTIPGWLNEKALEANINFSQTLQEALVERLGL
ncbi:type II toxin-antitoxin system HicB family antitoxin [Peptoniphilaceae bacterium SGI.137]